MENVSQKKTSEDWSKSEEFMGLVILEPTGWSRPLAASVDRCDWNKDLITKTEFLRRLYQSKITWSLSKL